MTEMQPHARPQRAENPENVDAHARELGYEPKDMPAGGVVKVLAGLFIGLALSFGGVRLLQLRLVPRWHVLSAGEAARRFTSPAPALVVNGERDRIRLEMPERLELRESKPGATPIEAAMLAVAQRGWGEDAPPPSRAETARARAEGLKK